MLPVLLHLDGALTGQTRLRSAVDQAGGHVLDHRDLGPALRLWSLPEPIDRLKRRLLAALPPEAGPALVFAGSGDFHHVTLPLVERALAAGARRDLTVVHFDNHPDWVRFAHGVHCGSWLARVARLPGVRRVITAGVCSSDIDRAAAKGADLDLIRDGLLEIYAFEAPDGEDRLRLCGREWPVIGGLGWPAFAELLLERVETEDIYLTIDKDVLAPEDAATNWDQGRTRLDDLCATLGQIGRARRVAGADVVGDWSRSRFGGGLLIGLLKRAEALLDQPWRAPAPERVAANEDANLQLLSHLQEAAA